MNVARGLIRCGEALCGNDSSRVFEPLIADWQREWQDARGVARLRVLGSGALAYLFCLARCARLPQMMTAAPTTGFALTLALFSVVAIVLLLQPLQHTWIGIAPRLRWLPYRYLNSYMIPGALAFGLAVALMPAAILAASACWSRRRLMTAIAISFAFLILLQGWIAPAATHAGRRALNERIPAAARSYDPRAFPNLYEALAGLNSTDRRVAAHARQRAGNSLYVVLMAVAFTAFGIALGRLRQATLVRSSLLNVGIWWLFAWTCYSTLQYWSPYGMAVAGLSGTSALFLPAAIFLVLSATIGVIARRTLLSLQQPKL